MSKVLKIDTTPYCGIWCILFIGTRDELKKYLVKYAGIDLVGSDNRKLTACVDWWNDGHEMVIWLPEFDWTIDDMISLSHECGHVAMRSLNYCRVSIGAECDEARAYFNDHILRQCLEFLKPKKKKK